MKHVHVPELPGIHTVAMPQPQTQTQPPLSTAAGFDSGPPLDQFGDRLIRLAHGQRGLRSGLPVQIQVPEPGPRVDSAPVAAAPAGVSSQLPAPPESEPAGAILDFISSSETLDRSDEIIAASGWRLENYRRNPVFQNAHQYGDVIFTLGRALITEVRPGPDGSPVLFQRIEFAVDVNPMARIAYGLYKGKFLNAVSVGFIPLRWENGGPDSSYRRKYVEQELLEVSAVGIPANPDALQLGLKTGAIEAADLRELADLCARALSASPGAPASSHSPSFPAVPNASAGASGVRNNEAQLWQLARAIRPLLNAERT